MTVTTRAMPATHEQHERMDLGLYISRNPAISTEVHVAIAANLNAANGTVLKLRIVEEIAAGATTFVFDLSRCERIDRRGQEILVSIKNLAARAGGCLRITRVHDRALEQLVASELAHLFEPELPQ
jgi:anti-anti-sigma regulatory factor